jgi:hypothetical protein
VIIRRGPAAGLLLGLATALALAGCTGRSGRSGSAEATTATESPRATSTPVPPTCPAGIAVTPQSNLQQLVDAAPDGSTFIFAAGTYSGFSADVKAGDRFCGAGAGRTTLDGAGLKAPAFFAGQATDDNVTVSGFTITNYRPTGKLGAIDSDATSDRAQGWTVSNNAVGSGSTVRDNQLNDNGRYGLTGGGKASVFSHNEIARNNSAHNDTGDAGGTKFAITTDLEVDHNWVHDNIGPGLWTDINNVGTVYDSNLVEGNTEAGIFHEISYACRIVGNVVRHNGTSSSPWVLGAGISISNSQGCDVSGNYVGDNANGIVGIASNRGGDATLPNYKGLWLLKDNSVHDNVVRQARGVSGIATDCKPNGSSCLDPYSSAAANSFDHDRYFVKGGSPFSWASGNKSFSQWQSAGQEKNGSSAAYAGVPARPDLAVGPTG